MNVSCGNCENVFKVKPSRLKKSKSGILFCCRDCADQQRGVGKMIEPNHYGTAPKVEVINTPVLNRGCLHCGTIYKPQNNTGKFCCKDCFNMYTINETKLKYDNIIENDLTHSLNFGFKRSIRERDNNQCTECGQGEVWNDKPLSLHVDHIDGDSDNNRASNLRTLCPHCHSQTKNYGAKNKGNVGSRASKLKQYRSEPTS